MRDTTSADLANEFGITREEVTSVLRKEFGSLANPSREWHLEAPRAARARELLARYVDSRNSRASADEGYLPLPDAALVNSLAVQIFENALDGGSLFSDSNVFSDDNLNVLFKRFVGRQKVEKGTTFFDKLSIQLAGVEDGPILLFAELLLLQIAPLNQIHPETKIGYIETVLNLAKGNHQIPPIVREALNNGMFGGGQRFSIKRYDHMVFILELVRSLREEDRTNQLAFFHEPRKCAALVKIAPGPFEPSLRNSIIYQLHPDYFLPVVLEEAKKLIVAEFAEEYIGREPSDDIDSELYFIDRAFTREHGQRPNFYDELLRARWDPNFEETINDEDFDGYLDEYSIDDILEEGCFYSADFLEELIETLIDKNNLILEGAPGTGKTWLARRLAAATVGADDSHYIRSVQFHPGTSYEDFVRGWRPDGSGTLKLIDGPIIEHANRAVEDLDEYYVLVIEEINRGNPAQAFGELLTLMEDSKRNPEDAIELAYMHADEEPLYLPPNLLIIGTMNIADRSLALVDFALRRRFAFQELEPQLNDAWRDDLIRKSGVEHVPKIDEIQRRITELNYRISTDRSLGPAFRIGHSYVTLKEEIDDLDGWFLRVVNREIVPLLKEYWIEDDIAVREIADSLRDPL